MRIFLQSGTLFAKLRIEFTKPADAVVFIVHGANQCAGILIAESICLNPQRILTKIILSQMIGQFRQFVRPEFLPEPGENIPHIISRNCPFRRITIQQETEVQIVFQKRFRIVAGYELTAFPLLVIPMPVIIEFDQRFAFLVDETVFKTVFLTFAQDADIEMSKDFRCFAHVCDLLDFWGG